MTAPTKEDVKRAERVIDNQTSGEEISCGPDGVDITDGLIMGIAQLLADERERVWRKAENEEIVCSKHKDWPSKEMPMYKVGCEDCQFVRGYNSKRLEITQSALADGVDLSPKAD